MTAAPNVEAVERLIAAAADRDLAGCLELLDPEVVWIPLRASTEGEYRGHAGFERFFADTDESFEEFEPRFELRDLGADRVLAWGTIHARGRGSGAQTDVPTGGVFELRGGRVSRWEDLGSREAALARLQPVDVMCLVYDAFNRDDLGEFLTYWDGDCTYHSAIHQMVEGDAAAFRGHKGIRSWWDDLHAHYRDLSVRVLAAEAVGDRVLTEFEVSGKGAGSGIANTVGLAQLAAVSAGRIAWAHDYASRAEALAAVAAHPSS